MTFAFSVGVGNITEFKMGLATPNGFTIHYAFNNGNFVSTGHNGSDCTEVDLTSYCSKCWYCYNFPTSWWRR